MFTYVAVKTIERPANCEIRSVIRFLNARNVLPSEIHRQICQVYGDNAISAGIVRKWVRMFNEGREKLHDEARSGRPCLVIDDLVRNFNERLRDDRLFTIYDLSLHFP
jgi:transposase